MLRICSEKSTEEVREEFKLIVTVYVDNVPTSDIDVTVGYIEFSRAAGGGTSTTFDRKTNEDGQVIYTYTPYGADTQYLCRAKNPFTNGWTSYRQANSLPGRTSEEKFYFTSED